MRKNIWLWGRHWGRKKPWENHYIVRKNSYCWWGRTCCNRQMKLQLCLLWGKSTRGDLFLQIILFFLVLGITWDVYFVNPPVEPISLHVRDRSSREMQLASQVNSWFLALPGDQARLNLFFQLSQASEVVPPTYPVPTAPQWKHNWAWYESYQCPHISGQYISKLNSHVFMNVEIFGKRESTCHQKHSGAWGNSHFQAQVRSSNSMNTSLIMNVRKPARKQELHCTRRLG